MRLRNRFMLISFGLAVFVIATPILVLYARGFKYDFATHQIIKTGSVNVASDPSGATVLLNNMKQSGETPSIIRFLTPGNYQVTIEKTGYQTWTKLLSVQAQFVTYAAQDLDAVSLFLTKPDQISSKTISNQPLTPTNDKDKITALLSSLQIPAPNFNNGQAIQGNNQIYLILDGTLYLVNGNLQKIYAPVTAATYDSGLRQLLYSNDNEIYLYNPQTQQSELILRTLTPIKNAQLNSDTGYVFYSSSNEIKTIELDGRDQRNIFNLVPMAPDFISFSVNDSGDKLTVLNSDSTLTYQIR